MELLDYHLNKNENGTYSCSYDYVDDSEQSFHVDMPQVELIYEMESLINKENIIFPNIKGHIILNNDETKDCLESKENENTVEKLETNPISYKFIVGVTIQSIEKDGEKYLKKLMHHFSNYDFKIVNGTYERKSVSHDRLGNHNPYHWDVIEVKLNLERLVKSIHSPSDYINNRLHGEIYRIFDWFRTHVVPNDSKLDYVSCINEGWCEIDE